MPHLEESRVNSVPHLYPCPRKDDEVPGDINAFFGHPLNSSLIDDSQALLHEFKNLPAYDHNENAEATSKGESDGKGSEIFAGLKFSNDKQSAEPFLSLHNRVKEEEFESLVNDAQFIREGNGEDSDCSLSNCKIEFKTDELDNIAGQADQSPCGNGQTADMDTNGLGEASSDFLDLMAESMRQGGLEHLAVEECSPSKNLKEIDLPPPFDAEVPPHSSPKPVIQPSFNTATVGSISSVRTTSPLDSHMRTSPMIKQEVPHPTDNQLSISQQQQSTGSIHSSQTSATANQQQQQPANISMMPQFMPVQIVQTSSGPMQVQPFIHNGQFGITQVSPCPPNTNMQSIARPMQGGWAPAYYQPFPPMPYRMQAPPMDSSGVPAPPMYYPRQDMFMVRPPYHTIGQTTPVLPQTGEVHGGVQPVFQPRPPAPVCNQLLQKQKSNQVTINGSSPPVNRKLIQQNGDPLFTEVKAHTEDGTAVVVVGGNHLKSPDSGFGDLYGEMPPSSMESEISQSNPNSPNDSQGTKRRRSSISLFNRQISLGKNLSNGTQSPPINFIKREDDKTGYKFTLEAAISCGARLEEDRMTYMNKGQYYTLVMENTLPPSQTSYFVKSVILLCFRDERNREGETKYWEFWHSRQSSDCQRAIDLDVKNSECIIEDTCENMGVNALTFAWDPHEPVKAQIAVHCLSTDFSNQKGVKGLPLHIQVDTYDDVDSSNKYPIHRAYAQIKIFCDKGAERKARDEERKKEKTKPIDNPGSKLTAELYHPPCDKTDFYTMADLTSEPFIYTSPPPTDPFEDCHFKPKSPACNSLSGESLPSFRDPDLLNLPVNPKKMKLNPPNDAASGFLVYVREAHEGVFTALMIKSACMESLAEAIQEKYSYVTDIHMIYKRTSRGILVKMDDNMVKHVSHESMFIIDIRKLGDDSYDITLVETDL